MASIRKRGHRWEAQVRKAGVASVNKSFLNKSDADRWARQTEAAIERGETPSTHNASFTYVSCILRQYLSSVTPSKRGASEEGYRINAMLGDAFAQVPIVRLSSQHVAD
jgi:hypothetical protein